MLSVSDSLRETRGERVERHGERERGRDTKQRLKSDREEEVKVRDIRWESVSRESNLRCEVL